MSKNQVQLSWLPLLLIVILALLTPLQSLCIPKDVDTIIESHDESDCFVEGEWVEPLSTEDGFSLL